MDAAAGTAPLPAPPPAGEQVRPVVKTLALLPKAFTAFPRFHCLSTLSTLPLVCSHCLSPLNPSASYPPRRGRRAGWPLISRAGSTAACGTRSSRGSAWGHDRPRSPPPPGSAGAAVTKRRVLTAACKCRQLPACYSSACSRLTTAPSCCRERLSTTCSCLCGGRRVAHSCVAGWL